MLMKNSIMPNQFVSKVFMNENSENHNSNNINPVPEQVPENAEPESKLTLEKAEKRAKLMSQIWGDAFLSDSLH